MWHSVKNKQSGYIMKFFKSLFTKTPEKKEFTGAVGVFCRFDCRHINKYVMR